MYVSENQMEFKTYRIIAQLEVTVFDKLDASFNVKIILKFWIFTSFDYHTVMHTVKTIRKGLIFH